MKEIYNVLWTGGLDSTFRITELSMYDCIIQPYYVIDLGRASNKIEQERMEEILNILRNSNKNRAELRDIIKIEIDTIKENREITNSWNNLREKYNIGSQYDWLSRYAHSNNIFLEIGLENSPRGKASAAIKSETVITLKNAICPYNIIIPEKSSEDSVKVFGRFHFPDSLWKMTKIDEIEWFKKNGYFNIAKKTWFCFNPIWGYPCGSCNPCKDALNEGMSWRVPIIGRILNLFRRILKKIIKICRL